MSLIVRALVTTNSTEDGEARVKVKIEGAFEESVLIPSVNAIPLKVGDHVYLSLDAGWENPLILGKVIDQDSPHSAYVRGSILWDSSDSEGNWTMAYVRNNVLTIQNSAGFSIVMDGHGITLNNGSNRGLVNVSAIESLVQAILEDLTQVGTGASTTKWMLENFATKLEDKSVTH